MYEQSYTHHEESGEQYMGKSQFPQPSRPIDIDYMNMFEESYPNQFQGGYHECYIQESGRKYVSDDDLFHILGEIAQEHDGTSDHDIFRKFFSKVEKDVHFDRLKKFYRLMNPENDSNAPEYQERGINIEASSTKGDIKHKLERFKIKNLNLGGVVKEEK
ncbi:hypothetical protein LIER_25698 [Lithospermum erythrorhizon]|uniref:Uncharacterized protein n=1 Tax=Lithospermum erythrorhizon TaxID=34254 RepID=A0AAV3R8Y9_LITER